MPLETRTSDQRSLIDEIDADSSTSSPSSNGMGFEQNLGSEHKKLYVCDIAGCNKAFSFPSKLARHTTTHDMNRSKQDFSSCGKTFVNLTLHVCTKNIPSNSSKTSSRFYCPFCTKDDLCSVDEVFTFLKCKIFFDNSRFWKLTIWSQSHKTDQIQKTSYHFNNQQEFQKSWQFI